MPHLKKNLNLFKFANKIYTVITNLITNYLLKKNYKKVH